MELAQKQLTGAIKIQTLARGGRDRQRVAAMRRQREQERRQIEWMRSYQKDTGASLGQSNADDRPEKEELSVEIAAGSGEGTVSSPSAADLSVSPDTRANSTIASEPADVPLTPESTYSGSTKVADAAEAAPAPVAAPAAAVEMPSLRKPPAHAKAPQPVPVAPHGSISGDDGDDLSVMNVSTHGSMSGLGLNETPPPSSSAALSVPGTVESSSLVGSIEDKIKKLEVLERSIQEKEQSMLMAAKLSEERAIAMEKALQQLEERNKREEADRQAREELLAIAAGPISHRSEYSSLRGSARGGRGRNSLPGTARSRHSAPPTARFAPLHPFCRILSYPIKSYPIQSYPILSYRIQPYPIQSYPILPYPILSFPVQSCCYCCSEQLKS